MVRTIVRAANGSGKKCITWKTANTEALLESKGKGTICIMQGPSNSQCVCTSHRSRGGKRCTCFALIFSPFFRVFIENFLGSYFLLSVQLHLTPVCLQEGWRGEACAVAASAPAVSFFSTYVFNCF